MATRWQKAEYLRNFNKALESHDVKLQFENEVIEDPVQWVKDIADWYDPLIEKENPLMEGIDKETLTFNKK
ncbi:hypothetical protein [Formosa haliotis]|uniref:hypothetical protein n=1 Tax=Formosa haliotis TaxID=1555194 RepID=UPI000826E245|nr:hypothetical protein [Formosa haliotis]